MSEKKSYYVTKYVLSNNGDIQIRALKPSPYDSTRLCGESYTSFTLGKDAFENAEDALKAANAARVKKVKSLQAQIDKLAKLHFTV